MVLPREGLLGSITILDEDGSGSVTASGAELIDVNGVVHETRGSAPATSVGSGAFWVESGSPSIPKFTNSAGITITLGIGGGGAVEVTADGIPNTDTITSSSDGYTVTIDLPNTVISEDSVQLGNNNRDILISDGYNIFVGSNIKVTDAGNYGPEPVQNNVLIGSNLSGFSAISESVYIGNNQNGSGPDNFSFSVCIGAYSANNADVSGSVIIGNEAAQDSSNAGSSVLIGYQAAVNSGSSGSSVGIGREVFGSSTASTSRTVAIGYEAFAVSTSDSTDSVAIGYQAGRNAGSNRSIMIGRSVDGADQSITLGYSANSVATGSVTIGYQANSDNAQGITIGNLAGVSETATSTQSIFMGYQSRRDAEADATSSIFIGDEAGYGCRSATSNTIAIGYRALYRNSGAVSASAVSNSIILANSFYDNSGNMTDCSVIARSNTASSSFDGTNRHWFGPDSSVPIDNFASLFGQIAINLSTDQIGLGTFTSNDLTGTNSRVILFSTLAHDDGILNISSTSSSSNSRPVITMTTSGTAGAESRIFVNNAAPSTTLVNESGSLHIRAGADEDCSIYQQIGTTSSDWIRKDPTISDVESFTGTRNTIMTDMGKTLMLSSGSGTLNVDNSVDFPVGTRIYVSNLSVTNLTVALVGGGSLDSASGALNIPQHGIATLWKRGGAQWHISGDLV